MRDLTESFCLLHGPAVRAMAAQLLRIDANVRSHHGVALAGGALRDTYFRTKVPKDLDFAFYGMTHGDLLEVIRRYRARYPSTVFEDITADAAEYEQEVTDLRILSVWRVTDGDTVMDWIQYNANTLAEATAMFDYNLNRFAMYYNEDFSLRIEWQAEDWGVCTRNPSSCITQEREERFREMARFLDWEYIE